MIDFKPSVLAGLFNIWKPDQLATQLEKIVKGECPFCQIDTELNKVDYYGRYWRQWENPYPHPNTRIHLVFAARLHWPFTKLNQKAGSELVGLAKKAVRKYQIEGGAIIWRFGDIRWNAGTVDHLHANLLVPNRQGALNPPLAKEVDVESVQARLDRFESNVRQLPDHLLPDGMEVLRLVRKLQEEGPF